MWSYLCKSRIANFGIGNFGILDSLSGFYSQTSSYHGIASDNERIRSSNSHKNLVRPVILDNEWFSARVTRLWQRKGIEPVTVVWWFCYCTNATCLNKKWISLFLLLLKIWKEKKEKNGINKFHLQSIIKLCFMRMT